jgi:uncharacterized protein (TIGR03083 family)
MTMSIDHDTADSLLAAYVLDAVEVDEALAVEEHLATCDTCQRNAVALRSAAEPLGLAVASAPPPELRGQVLATALAHRPAEHHPFEPADVHLIESTRLLALLRNLADDEWSAPVGPAFPDWSVQDLAAHLASSEALLAIELGADPFAPESETQADERAHAAVARHRRLAPSDTLAELNEVYGLVHTAIAALGADASTRIVQWFGLDLSLDVALTQRSFEIWTHADDIRAAIGLDAVPPPGGSLETMSHAAVDTIPLMLSFTGHDAEGRRARIVLTGDGGGTYDLALGLAEPPTGGAPDVELELDVVEFCKAIGDRRTEDDLDYRWTGDAELAEGIVRALPALAVL